MITSAARVGMLGRAWSRYTAALREHPVRTKMATSGTLYVVGDNIAQFDIEGRSLRGNSENEDDAAYDVSTLVLL